jgi:hypothetical protein
MSGTARKLCRQFGIQIVKSSPWREMQTRDVNVIGRLIAKHGPDKGAKEGHRGALPAHSVAGHYAN